MWEKRSDPITLYLMQKLQNMIRISFLQFMVFLIIIGEWFKEGRMLYQRNFSAVPDKFCC